jgi:hypothetical protein
MGNAMPAVKAAPGEQDSVSALMDNRFEKDFNFEVPNPIVL